MSKIKVKYTHFYLTYRTT